MWGRSAAVAAAVAVLACAVAAPGRAAAAGVPAAGDAGATDSAVPVAASFIAEGPDLFPVVCVMFSWPGHPQDRVGCVAHLGYVAQVLRTGHGRKAGAMEDRIPIRFGLPITPGGDMKRTPGWGGGSLTIAPRGAGGWGHRRKGTSMVLQR